MRFKLFFLFFFLLTSCTTYDIQGDFTKYENRKFSSVLVVIPKNETNDVDAVYGVYTTVTRPLAERGYYVFPIVVVDELFKHNGITNAYDIDSIKVKKLREIFDADGILYLTVKRYGPEFKILETVNTVTIEATLIDALNDKVVWHDEYSISRSNVKKNDKKEKIVFQILNAAASQIKQTSKDSGHFLASSVTYILLSLKLKERDVHLHSSKPTKIDN